MAKFVTARNLKNQATALIREADKGKAVVVTRGGKPEGGPPRLRRGKKRTGLQRGIA
jgi:hypothetical protein